jgi:hypothetical protein
VLTPRPRVNLILYYGILAPRAAWRAAVVPATSRGVDVSVGEASRRVEADGDTSGATPSRNVKIMKLMRPMKKGFFEVSELVTGASAPSPKRAEKGFLRNLARFMICIL